MPYKDIEKLKNYRRLYRLRNKQRVLEYNKSYLRKWRQSNKDKQRGYDNARDRSKVNARMAVYLAVKSGRLVRPATCENCGHTGSVEADHKDYSKRLDVSWLCKPCHNAVTAERKELY